MKLTREGIVYRQIYVGPEASKRSYEADLRGITEAGIAAWVAAQDAEGLRALWEMRYAGDDASERLFGDLVQGPFRRFLVSPFEFQPKTDRGTMRLRP